MHSRDIVVLCQHAESAFKSANYELARDIYSKIIELDPKNIKAIEGEAYCFANLGNHSAAFAHLEKICDSPEVSAQALYFLGSYYL
jgi:Flp pilus assembly protein TadD